MKINVSLAFCSLGDGYQLQLRATWCLSGKGLCNIKINLLAYAKMTWFLQSCFTIFFTRICGEETHWHPSSITSPEPWDLVSRTQCMKLMDNPRVLTLTLQFRGDCKDICHRNSTCMGVSILGSHLDAYFECHFTIKERFNEIDFEIGTQRGTYLKCNILKYRYYKLLLSFLRVKIVHIAISLHSQIQFVMKSSDMSKALDVWRLLTSRFSTKMHWQVVRMDPSCSVPAVTRCYSTCDPFWKRSMVRIL